MNSASSADMWHYREGGAPVEDIAGFSIEARDGDIGKVDKANAESGSAYLIVAAGPWIFGKTVILPAGIIERIDYKAKVVHVNRSQADIKSAPEYDEDRGDDETYHNGLADYYSGLGA
jgi:hypothetical protein